MTPLKPLIINPGATASFKCGVKGTPTPVITWGKGGDIVLVDDRTSIAQLDPGELEDVLSELTLYNVQGGDSGLYWCNASSGLYRSSSGAELVIFGDPVTPESPASGADLQIVTPLKSLIINPGATATFKCGVKGTPTPVITWGKGGNVVLVDNRTSIEQLDPGDQEDVLSELTLLNVQDSDSGLYWCNASSGLYRSSSGAELVIFGDPVTPEPPAISVEGNVNAL